MKQAPLVLASMMVFALTGCMKDDLDGGGAGGDVTLNMSVGINNSGYTKAALDAFPTPSDIGLFFTTNASDVPLNTGWNNMKMTINGATKTYATNDGTAISKLLIQGTLPFFDLWGYYPYQTGTPTSVPIDLTLPAQESSQTDVLFSKLQTVAKADAGAVTMSFVHAYALLEFQVKLKIDDLTNPNGFSRVTVSNKTDKSWLYNKGTLAPKTGVFTGTAAGPVSLNYADGALNATTYKTFSVMIPPVNAATFADGDLEVQFTAVDGTPKKLLLKKEYLTGGTELKSGYKYSFKLLYDNQITGTLILQSWTESSMNTPTIGGNKPATWTFRGSDTPEVIEGVDEKYIIATTSSYNGYRGEAEQGKNGAYLTEYNEPYHPFVEPPYFRLEVDKQDAVVDPIDWKSARYVCEARTGGWRMPRATEMKYIVLNAEHLDRLYAKDGFAPLNKDEHYWSATECSVTKAYLIPPFTYGNTHEAVIEKKETPNRLRCVRELPNLTPPTMLGFRGENCEVTDNIPAATAVSYNTPYWKKTVAEGGNGGYQPTNDAAAINTAEPPYHLLEISKSDRGAYEGWDESNAYCQSLLPQGQWRIPRFSEMYLMIQNKHLLDKAPGFTPLELAREAYPYLTATEHDGSSDGIIGIGADDLSIEPLVKSGNYRLRCVREVSSAPAIIEYGGKYTLHIPEYKRRIQEGRPETTPYPEAILPTTYSYNGLGKDINGNFNFGLEIKETADHYKDPIYLRLEVAKSDLKPLPGESGFTWQQSITACQTELGPDWRMPRFTELEMIMESGHVLKLQTAGYQEIPIYTIYRSGTIQWSSGEEAWAWTYQLSPNQKINIVESAATHPIRCVRELPDVNPIIMMHGGLRGSIITDLPTSTKDKIYNSYLYYAHQGWDEDYNEISGYGVYWDPVETAYENEPPYYKLEIDKEDLRVNGGSASSNELRGWGEMRDQNITFEGMTIYGDICQVRGAGWRMPRISELKLILQNHFEFLERAGYGFVPMVKTVDIQRPAESETYWSSTEYSQLMPYYASFDASSRVEAVAEGYGYRRVRCVRAVD